MNGRQVVLLHGQPGSGADWQRVADRLPAGLDVLALDRPGYGASPLRPGGFAANARAVAAELDARGVGKAVLVGHSYGGGVALALAGLAPERVEALVLLASVGPGCLSGWDRLLSAPVAGEVCAFTAWRLSPWLGRAYLAALARFRGRPIGWDEHVNVQIWGHSRRHHQPLWRTFLTEQRALVRELGDLAEGLGKVTQPTLVIADPSDGVVPVATARELAAALPGARLRLVNGVGHHFPRRAAALVADAVAEFTATLDERPAPA